MAARESSGNPRSEQAGRSVRPISPKRKPGDVKSPLQEERRKLEHGVRKKNEKLRGRYRAVHGKVVDWVDHAIEDGNLFVSIRFRDKTDFCMQFSPKIVAEEIDLCDVRDGKFRLMWQYFRRRGES